MGPIPYGGGEGGGRAWCIYIYIHNYIIDVPKKQHHIEFIVHLYEAFLSHRGPPSSHPF